MKAQKTTKVLDPAFDQKIAQYLEFSVPIISVEDALKLKEEALFLDAREREEFDLSHIPGASFVGYENFNIQQVENLNKEQSVIIYCSIGYRSEKIAEKLSKAGFKKVYNLYGSIFEWANRGHLIVNKEDKPTKKLHTYNKEWSKWVDNPEIEKHW
jgi:rhodanese-related sulfurtransferase